MHPKRTKLSVAILALLLLLATVTAASYAQSSPTKLRVATWIDRSSPGHVSAWQEVLDGWAVKYPDIEIELQMIPYGEYFTKLAVLVSTGEIDVFDISDSRTAQYAATGSLVDLTPYIERDLDLDDYYMVSLNRGRFPQPDGPMYTIWTFMSPAMMYVNTDLFDKAGVMVSNDWTYDDMHSIAQKLVRDNNGDGTADEYAFGPGFGTFAGRRGYGMGSLLRSFGAEDYSPDGTRYAMDSPQHREAYEFAYSFIEQGLTRMGMGATQFRQGILGLNFDGTFTAARLSREAQFNWTMVKPPAGPAGSKVILHGNPSLAISAHTPYKEESWAFIRHVLESQTATSIYLEGNMPTKRSAAEEWIRMGAELWPGFDPVAAMGSIEGAVFLPVISPEDAAAESAITSVLTRAARGEMPFATALEEATRQANAIIGE